MCHYGGMTPNEALRALFDEVVRVWRIDRLVEWLAASRWHRAVFVAIVITGFGALLLADWAAR